MPSVGQMANLRTYNLHTVHLDTIQQTYDIYVYDK